MSRLKEYITYRLIGTSVEQPLRQVRSLKEVVDRQRHPEWNAVRDEGWRIERVLRRAIQPTMNCIDIGCHLGAVLERMQKYAPQGRHMAFEPTPYKFQWLKAKYPEIEIRQEALSDQPGEAEFFYQTDHSGFSGLRAHGDKGWKTETFRVQCRRLDDIVPADRRIGFIKIDVEGAEPLVFRGAERILRESHPHLLFECTLTGLALFDIEPQAVYTYLCADLGYSIYLIKDWLEDRPPLDQDRFLAAMHHPAQAFNFIASAPNSPPLRK